MITFTKKIRSKLAQQLNQHKVVTDGVYWSPELEAIFGLPIGAFSGTLNGFYDYVYEEDKKQIATEVEQAQRGN